jgi:hypothetical protein
MSRPVRFTITTLVLVTLVAAIAWTFGGFGDVHDAPEVEVGGDSSEPASAPALAARGGRAPHDSSGSGANGSGEVEIAAGGVRFAGRWTLHVRNSKDRSPVPRAHVEASFPLVSGARQDGPELLRQATTDDDGAAVLSRMPVGRDVSIGISREWFVAKQTIVAASSANDDNAVREVEILLDPTLSREESETTLLLDIDPAATGIDPDSIRMLVKLVGSASLESVAPGGAVFLGNQPGSPGVRKAQIQVSMPGYVGPWEDVELTRGKSLHLPFRPPPLVNLRFVVATSDGRRVAGATVELWPVRDSPTFRAATRKQATTRADGTATLSARQGDEIVVSVSHPKMYFPPRDWNFVAPVGAATSRQYLLTVLALAPLIVEVEGGADLPEKEDATLRFSDVHLLPEVEEALRRNAHPTRTQSPIVGYRDRMPESARLSVSADGVRTLELGLLPGTYALEVATPDRSSAVETFALPPQGLHLRVLLRKPEVLTFHVMPQAGARDPGFLRGAVVIGHRAGWDERFAIEQALGSTWKTPRSFDGASAEVADMIFRLASVGMRSLRGRDPRVPLDVAFVDLHGVASLATHGSPEAVTVMIAEGGVAVIRPSTVGSGSGELVVPESEFRAVRVRVLAADGAPRAGFDVHPNPTSYVAEQRLELSVRRTTNAAGEFDVGALVGEEFALYAHGTFEPTASGGAVFDRRAWASGEAQFVVVRWAAPGDALLELRSLK